MNAHVEAVRVLLEVRAPGAGQYMKLLLHLAGLYTERLQRCDEVAVRSSAREGEITAVRHGR